MRRHLHTVLFAILAICACPKAFAQDPQFSQFYAAPLYLNPAFAGSTLESRLMLNNRYQWAGLPKAFVTYSAGFDHNFEKYKSGIGFLGVADKAGTGGLMSTSLSFIYSYKLHLSNNLIVRPGIQFGYASRSIDFYKLTFGDQLMIKPDPNKPNAMTAETFNRNSRVNFFDLGSGILIHNQKFWIGFSAQHLNRPDQSLDHTGSNLPIKSSLHGGVKFTFEEGPYKKSYGKTREKSISPAFNYRSQGKFDQLDLGLYFYYDPLVLGFWYRGIPVLKRYKAGYGNNDAIAVLLGIKLERISVGYSYDMTISKLTPGASGGSHEFSLSYVFISNKDNKKKPKLRRKDMVIPCPKF